uniref:Cyclin-G1-like n=1 Tax=Sinocyclocheilus grahami TaxID=75366 RepID=A0A672KFN1_SINGR
MIDQVTGAGALPFTVQLKALLDQEARYQPKLCGLRVVESAQDNGLRMTVKLRDFQVRDLLSLTRFFGFSSETFSLAVNLLDRFLAVMKQLDAESKRTLNIERLEAQLKACHCSFTFTKIKPSLLALALLALEIEDQHECEPVPALREALGALQQSLTVSYLSVHLNQIAILTLLKHYF